MTHSTTLDTWMAHVGSESAFPGSECMLAITGSAARPPEPRHECTPATRCAGAPARAGPACRAASPLRRPTAAGLVPRPARRRRPAGACWAPRRAVSMPGWDDNMPPRHALSRATTRGPPTGGAGARLLALSERSPRHPSASVTLAIGKRRGREIEKERERERERGREERKQRARSRRICIHPSRAPHPPSPGRTLNPPSRGTRAQAAAMPTLHTLSLSLCQLVLEMRLIHRWR